MKRRFWPLLLASMLATALLMSLGFWQLRRLEEKQTQIAIIDQRLAAEPVSLEEALQFEAEEGDLEYLKVKLQGRFLEGKEFRKLTSVDSKPGFTVIQPFVTDINEVVLVDRGGVPENMTQTPQSTETEVVGILRKHDKGQGMFDPDNDAAQNKWYWWDVEAMLENLNPPDGSVAMPLVLQRMPKDGDTGFPVSSVPKAELRNNHLGYAVTWFGLALVTVVMTVLLWLRNKKTPAISQPET